jgi:hypothetical protein
MYPGGIRSGDPYVAPISLMAGGDNTTRPLRQDYLPVCSFTLQTQLCLYVRISNPLHNFQWLCAALLRTEQ